MGVPGPRRCESHAAGRCARRTTACVGPDRGGTAFLVVLALALYAATWEFFGGFTAFAVMVGALLAVALRAWNTRHPDALVCRAASAERAPEINVSAIHVGGDAAGLTFAAGSVAIVIIGLWAMWWYFLAAAAGSLIVAGALVRHRQQPHASAVNSIAPRTSA